MNKTTSLVVVAGITVMLTAFGVTGAVASEITGTLSAGSSGGIASNSSSSSGAGFVSGTVVGGSNASSQSSSNSQVARSGGGRSTIAGSNGGSAPIQSSGGGSSQSAAPASDAGLTGTGGGYDPNLDSYLASLNSPSGSSNVAGGISASDAIAYNTGANPLPLDNTAAAAATGTTGKVMTIILVGLAVLGLGGYAVNSYLAYRRERGL